MWNVEAFQYFRGGRGGFFDSIRSGQVGLDCSGLFVSLAARHWWESFSSPSPSLITLQFFFFFFKFAFSWKISSSHLSSRAFSLSFGVCAWCVCVVW